MSRNTSTQSNKTYSTKKSSRTSQQNNLNYRTLFLWINFLWGLMPLGIVGQRQGVQAQALPATLDLANFMATQGTVIEGAVGGDNAGYSVASAGDVNGDGLSDLLVGAWQAAPVSRSNAGAAYLIYGSRALSAVLDLNALTPAQGMMIQGAMAGDGAGFSVSSTGDVNGDGLSDLLVGAQDASPLSRSRAGAVYLIYGSQVLPALFDLNITLTATQGMVIQGARAGDRVGWSVASSGDVNGDNITDFVVGALYASPVSRNGAGAAYLIYGSRTLPAILDLSTITATQGMVIQGAVTGDFAGISVSSAGDVNGDNIADLVIGVYHASPVNRSKAGATTLIYGNRVLPTVLDLNALTANQGMLIQGGGAGDRVGYSVSSAGDVNGDGISDLLIGAISASPLSRSQAGAAYLIYGNRTLPAVLDLNALTASQGMVIQGAVGDNAGSSVSSAGDINGDGITDMLVGAWHASPANRSSAGAAYLIYGSRTLPALLDLGIPLTATQGTVIQGAAAGDYTGYSVSSAGDVNGDSKSDILIGAYNATPQGRSGAGVLYLIYSNVFPVAPSTVRMSQPTTLPTAVPTTTTTHNYISTIGSGTEIGIAVGAASGGIALAACLAAVGFYAYRKKSGANQSNNSASNNDNVALKDKNTVAAQTNYGKIDATKKNENEYDDVPKLEI